jgi:large subunit ribosomal protein L4
MNRKERRLALRTAFVGRIDDLIVVEEFSEQLSRPKTKDLVAALARWGAAPENKTLLVLSEFPENVYLSARNIENLKLIAADQLNVYDLLHADKIVLTTSALEKIQEVYSA